MSGRLRPTLALFALAALVAFALPASAVATFHLVQVREAYPGSAASPDAEFVELQMYAGGQNLVGGHFVRSFDAAGNPVATSTFAGDVANGANQSTMLLATPQAEAQFGVAADAPLSPGQLSPAGGAVCWETIDCVSWGAFGGSLASLAGTPAAAGGIPDGMALRRTIARGCATSLEAVDDTNQSASDFESVFPAPRPNSVPPSEVGCAGGGAAGGGADGNGSPNASGAAPQTFLRRKPSKRTRDRTPTFRFASNQGAAKFECKLDRRRFRPCRSPYTRRLGLGPHRFRVRATADEARDPTPASYRFKILPPRRR